MSVYRPQYILKARAAVMDTMPVTIIMSGAQTSMVTAAGMLIGAITANRVIGARIA